MATVDVRPAKLNYKITRGDDFADQVTIKENGVAVASPGKARRVFDASAAT